MRRGERGNTIGVAVDRYFASASTIAAEDGTAQPIEVVTATAGATGKGRGTTCRTRRGMRQRKTKCAGLLVVLLGVSCSGGEDEVVKG